MFFNAIFVSLACMTAWFLLLPILVIGGGTILFVYATLWELGALLTGSAGNSIDPTTAREIARRICLGYGGAAWSIP
jgi:lipoprotein signal peptidase